MAESTAPLEDAMVRFVRYVEIVFLIEKKRLNTKNNLIHFLFLLIKKCLTFFPRVIEIFF